MIPWPYYPLCLCSLSIQATEMEASSVILANLIRPVIHNLHSTVRQAAIGCYWDVQV